MKTYAVTGTTGFIGGALTRRLLEDGHIVNAILRAESSKNKITYLLEQFPDTLHCFIHDSDDKELTALSTAVTHVDGVFHLGALYVDRNDAEAITNLVESNILFSSLLFAAMDKADGGQNLVAASTFSAFDDDGRYAPHNYYSATKAAVEALARSFSFNATFLRFGDTFGPNDKRPKVHNLLRNYLLKNEHFAFRSHADKMINLVHVNDVVNALINAMNISCNSKKQLFSTYELYERNQEITLGYMAMKIFEAHAENIGITVTDESYDNAYSFPQDLPYPTEKLPPVVNSLPGWKPSIPVTAIGEHIF